MLVSMTKSLAVCWHTTCMYNICTMQSMQWMNNSLIWFTKYQMMHIYIDNAYRVRKAKSTNALHALHPFQDFYFLAILRWFKLVLHWSFHHFIGNFGVISIIAPLLEGLFLPPHFLFLLLSQSLESTLSCGALGNPVVAPNSLEEKNAKICSTTRFLPHPP